jgi:hypothetical protein
MRRFRNLNFRFMATSVNINDILSQVKKLGKEDQLTLLERLVILLKKKEEAKNNSVRLTSLSGLGSEIWSSNNDIDNYIE